MINSILNWVYPPTCMACNQWLALNNKQHEMWLCHRCKELFEPIKNPICNICGVPMENPVPTCSSCNGKNFSFSFNHATFTYDDILRDVLLDLKFNNKKNIAHGLGKLWAEKICYSKCITDSVFIPLPMHKKKQKERGFNQAEILSTELSKQLKTPTLSLLQRSIDTPPQAGLHPKLRAENVKDVFVVKNNLKLDSSINYIIIDDIYTTGASLNECAKTLKKAGANHVSCMTLAVTVKSSLSARFVQSNYVNNKKYT